MPHSASAALLCGRLRGQAVSFQLCGLLCGLFLVFSDAEGSYTV